jgi:hypothetical protein
MKTLIFGLFFSFIGVFGQEKSFPKSSSTLQIPLQIPLQELNAIINKNTADLLYQDDSYTDNNNDQFKIKVWKARPIRLVVGTKENLLIEVPLKIWAEKGIGTLGYYNYQNTTFETVMYFDTTVSLKENWTISTETKALGYKWVQKPVLDFGKIKIPITQIVEKNLKAEQAKFCSKIDEQMAVNMNFQKNILDTWNVFGSPILVNEAYKTWLKISPQKIAMSPLKFYKDQLQTTIGVVLISETFTGEKPKENPILKTVPNFEIKEIPNSKFNIVTTASLPLSEAQAIAEKQFLDKEFDFRNGKIKITDIQVTSENDRINIEAETEEAIQGKILISGRPIYNQEKRKIVLIETKFQLKTKNILQKAAVLIFKGKILKTIEEEYGIPTTEMENSAKIKLEESINKNFANGIKMQGKVFAISPKEIVITENKLLVQINTEAQLNLTINGTIN